MEDKPINKKVEIGEMPGSPEIDKRLLDLEGSINERALRIRQRIEMLKEGHRVSYHGLELILDDVIEATEQHLVLKNPDSGIITEVPASLLAELDWQLVPPAESRE